MPYYGRGDYRRVGYRRGDPFSITGLIGGLAKTAISTVTGGPLAGLKTAAGLLSSGSPAPVVGLPVLSTPNVPISTLGSIAPMVQVPSSTPGAIKTPGFGGLISRILPGGETGYEVPLRGYHVIKKGPNAGQLARNRRMNVVNPHALRRSIRRVSGFGKLVRRMKRGIARANSAVGNVHHARKPFRKR
jgi:hypothetical protein